MIKQMKLLPVWKGGIKWRKYKRDRTIIKSQVIYYLSITFIRNFHGMRRCFIWDVYTKPVKIKKVVSFEVWRDKMNRTMFDYFALPSVDFGGDE